MNSISRRKTSAEEIEYKSRNALRRATDILLFNLRALKNKASFYITSLLFTVLVIICVGVFWPYADVIGLFYLCYLVLPLLVLLGWTSYNITSSSLINNIRCTGIKSVPFYLAQLFTVLIMGNILSIIFWPIIYILGISGVFIPFWVDKFVNNNQVINVFANYSWIYMIYITQIYIFVTFTVYMLMHVLLSTATSYYLTVISLLLLSIIYGGIINTYFTIPPGFGGNMKSAMNVTGSKGTDWYLNEQGIVITQDFFNKLMSSNIWWDKHTIYEHGNAFPHWMFIPSLFFPYYGAGEFANKTIGYTSCWNELYGVKVFIEGNSVDISQQLMSHFNSPELTWYSWITIDPRKGNGLMWLAAELQPFIIIFMYSSMALGIRYLKRQR